MSASVDNGRTFVRSAGGRWAAERMLNAMKQGRMPCAADLRTADTLRKDEWIHFDSAVVEEAHVRLRAWADVIAAGLTIPIPNSMGKTMYEYDKVSDMDPAQTSLDGITRTDNDRQEFELDGVPLPITHKDFRIHLRTLAASRSEGGEPLDTMQSRTSARLVAERLESTLLNGASKQFGGRPIFGYTNHPAKNNVPFGTNGAWTAAAKTGENILADVLSMISVLNQDRMFGPYWLYVPTTYGVKILEDFKTNSDKTIRQRIEEIPEIAHVTVVDQLTNHNVLLVQGTRDVVAIAQGEPIQTIQWDIEGGMAMEFKVMTIAVPVVRSDFSGRSGIAHMF